MKKIISILMLIYLINPTIVYAQLPPAVIINPKPVTPAAPPAPVQSNSVITQFGNAPQDQKPNLGNTDLSKAGQDLVEAYSQCPPSSKSDFVGLLRTECLQAFLKTRGYPSQALIAFGIRRVSSKTGAECAECLGFVALALTLISADINTLLGSPIEPGINIGNPAYVYNRLSQFPVGSQTYSFTGRMEEGAVGMGMSHELERLSGVGHALIVKQVVSNDKFIGYESSYYSICQVTNNVPHVKEAYKFYTNK